MIKKILINDKVMYMKSRESGLRIDYYFNRKGCDNNERGHFAIENGEAVCQRPAPALNLVLFNGSIYLDVSGTIFFPLQNFKN